MSGTRYNAGAWFEVQPPHEFDGRPTKEVSLPFGRCIQPIHVEWRDVVTGRRWRRCPGGVGQERGSVTREVGCFAGVRPADHLVWLVIRNRRVCSRSRR